MAQRKENRIPATDIFPSGLILRLHPLGGKTPIAVRLNTEKWGSRWYPGAGIYRHVRLVKTSRLHVGQWGVFVTTPQVSRQQATAKVQVSIRNRHQAAQPCHYTIDIYEVTSANRRGKRVAHTSSSTLNIKAGDSITSLSEVRISQPKLWELDAPCRYLARVTVYQGKKATDSYDALFGIRTIEFSHDKGFLLNGKHVPIQAPATTTTSVLWVRPSTVLPCAASCSY